MNELNLDEFLQQYNSFTIEMDTCGRLYCSMPHGVWIPKLQSTCGAWSWL